MNNKGSKETGFTLIELIVVLVITGLLLWFALPNFQAFNPLSQKDNILGKTVQLIEQLKRRAVTEDRDYLMHVEVAEGLIWVSNNTMDEDQMNEAKNKGLRFSGDTILVGVEFPQPQPENMDVSLIGFYRKGYSDMALIQLKDNDQDDNVTLVIEPFLANVALKGGGVSFDRCR